MALKKWFWLNGILFCLYKQGDLFAYLFSSMHNECNIVLLLPRSEVSWIKSQGLSHSVTYSFSLSRGQEVGQGRGKPSDMANSVLLQLSTRQNGRLQLCEVGRFAEFGGLFPGRVWEHRITGWRTKDYFVDIRSPFCTSGKLLPVKYWKDVVKGSHTLGMNL